MAGISSKAVGEIENKEKYNGIAFENDLEIQTYDAFFRELDPQTARWWQIDPITEGYEHISPYASMYNNPVSISDILGNEGEDCCWDKIKAGLEYAGGFVYGTVAAVSDNLTGGNNRSEVGKNFAGTGAAAEGYNAGLKVGDAGSMVIGVNEVSGGIGLAAGGGGLTLASGGTATPVSGPAVAGGLTIASHGIFTFSNGFSNLINENGKVNVSSNNSTGSNGASSKQRNAPQQQSTPNSSKIEAKDASGKTTKYSTYGSDGNLKKQVQVDKGSSRHGVSGATKKVPNYNTNPTTGQKHVNGYKIKKAMPAETPPGRN